MSDQSHGLADIDVGTALIIDGTKPHYSEPFNGFRVSVVAFMHKATMDLPAPQLDYLRSLGFSLPAVPASTQTQPCLDILHGSEGIHCPSCFAYWSDSKAYRLPGYGVPWDALGPVEQIGLRSAR